MQKNEKIIQKPLLRLHSSITISNLWLSILSLATIEPIYAYTLADSIEKKFGFKPSRLLVYLVLYKLENEGFLRSKEQNKRNYYYITTDGKALLKRAKELLIARAEEI